MTEKQWINLKDGDIVHNATDGDMEVVWYGWDEEAKKVLCFKTEKCIFLGSQFNPNDWELKKVNDQAFNTWIIKRGNHVVAKRSYDIPKTQNQLRRLAVDYMVNRDIDFYGTYIDYSFEEER